jgi:hypothetical protein
VAQKIALVLDVECKPDKSPVIKDAWFHDDDGAQVFNRHHARIVIAEVTGNTREEAEEALRTMLVEDTRFFFLRPLLPWLKGLAKLGWK